MKLRAHLVAIFTTACILSSASADTAEELAEEREQPLTADRQLKEDWYARNKSRINAELAEFRAVVTKKNLVAFLVRISPSFERTVLRSVVGSPPSDALTYVGEMYPPGVYVVGILRPDTIEAFHREKATRTFLARIAKDDNEFPEIAKETDLSRLLQIREAEAGTGEPATRSGSDSEDGDKTQPESEGRSR